MASLNDVILKDAVESTEALSKNFGRIQKDYGLALHEAKQFYQLKGELIKESNLAELKANAQNAKLSAEERAKYARQAAAVENQIEMKAATSIIKFKEALYSKFDAAQKVDYQKSLQAKEQAFRKTEEANYQLAWAKAKAQGANGGQLAAITRKHNKEKRDSIKREIEARRQQAKEEIALSKQVGKENDKRAQDTKNALKAAGKAVGENIKAGNLKGSLKAIGAAAGATLGTISKLGETSIKDLAANQAKASKEAAEKADAKVSDIQGQLAALEGDNSQEAEKLREELSKELAEATKEAIAANNKATIDQMKSMAVGAVSDAYDRAFAAAETTMKSYQSHIDARLQGSDKSWKKANNLITNNLGLSTIVRTTDVIEKLKEAVDQGISYNVEQRAFLAEISDKIANTFDAFDASLLRLVKLQQADSTAARLGMEAMLTKFLNSTFEDSSYLTSLADSVAGAIVDASSQLTNAQAAEFDYIVHKWLGALSSVGISDDAVNTIAQGINYLATGDVQNLASNTQLTTMFAMAASRANLEYSELLLEGLDASKTNKLLEGMLSYLADIAKGAENQVVKSAYGDILNLSLSDFKAIENLSSSISSIAGNTVSYGNMLAETDSQLSSLISKVSLSEQLSNIYDNAIYSVASDMVNNPITWATQKMLNFMDKNQLDINIPFINVMGFGLDLNTSIKGLMRVGMGLSQGFSFMSNLLSSLASKGGTDLDAWGAKETTKRGSGMSSSTSTTLGATSSSVYVTNTNEEDVKNSTLNSATDEAEETKEVTNKNTKTENTFDDFYMATIGESATDWVVTDERHLAAVYRSSGIYLHTRDERMEFITGNKEASQYLATYDPTTKKFLNDTLYPAEALTALSTSTILTKLNKLIIDETKLNVSDSALSDTNAYLAKFTFDSDTGGKLNVATSMDTFFTTNTTSLPVSDSKLDGKLKVDIQNTSIAVTNGNFKNIGKITSPITFPVSNTNFSKLGLLKFDASNILQVSDNRYGLDGGYLKVVDKNSTSSNSVSGSVKVTNLPASLDSGHLKVKIMNASDIKSSATTNISGGVTIDTKSLENALVKALHRDDNLSDNTYNPKSVYGVLSKIRSLLSDGDAMVKVINTMGGSTIPVKDNSLKAINSSWNV